MEKFVLNNSIVLQSFKNGDEDAFRRVFDFFHNRLYSFVFSITKSHYTAEEIIQEVFIKLWYKRETIEVSSSFDSFVFTITKNLTYNFLRDAAKRETLKTDFFYISDFEKRQTENAVLSNEYEDLLNDIVERLPKQKKSVFIMSRQEGKSNQEISSLLGISEKTVKNHLWKTLQIIKAQLEPHLDIIIIIFIASKFF